MTWVQWLQVERRHLVWMRAQRHGWRDICHHLACDRTTAWRRWQQALEAVASHLNDGSLANFAKTVSMAS